MAPFFCVCLINLPPVHPKKVNQRRRWYYEVTLVGASKGTRVGWARCGGAFSRGVSSSDGVGDGDGEGRGRPDAAVPKLGYGGDSWGICGHKQGKSYHQAARVRAGRVEAAAKARRDKRKEDGEDGEEYDGGEEAGTKDRSRGEGGSSGGTESGGEAAGEDQEEDTADSIFLALGGLFRDTSFTVDQEGEDGGNPIEYLPAAAAAAAAAVATTAVTLPTPSIPLPLPPVSSRLNPALAPSTPPPPPPPPPPLPSATARSAPGMKLPRSPFSRETDSPLRPWGAGAVIGCLADLVGADGDRGAGGGKPGEVRLHFFLNGRPVNGNASAPIFTTTAADSETDWSLCPAFSCCSASDGVTVNLGDTPFQFPPDGLIATLGTSPAEGGGGSGGGAAAAASLVASPSSIASTREKRSRYGSGAAAAMLDRTSPHAVLGRAAERALESAFGVDHEGRASPSPASAHTGGSGGVGSGEVGSPHSGSSTARTMAEALRSSPSKKVSSDAAENNAATGGKQGRTKGIVGGVLAVRDAAVSRCVRFDGRGWAVARRPNLTVQALDVFLLEALIRPTARGTRPEAGSGGGEAAAVRSQQGEEQELVVLSQAGASGFCLAVQGTKAVLQLNGPDPTGAGEHARHATPEGVLPAAGEWFKLSAAVARDASQGVDKVRARALRAGGVPDEYCQTATPPAPLFFS